MRLIDAEALKTAIQDHFDNLDAYFPSAFIAEVEDAPTINPCENCDLYFKAMTKEAQKGNWTIGYTAKQKKVAVCNLCNCVSFQGKTNFCHNCGAKMQKGGAE